MPRALKVFRTSAGFHDAYVAAPSRKAALAAWGANVDLFARGIAEEVSDPGLTKEPLANPGEVIMLSRGGLADQLKALGPRKVAAKAKKDAAQPPKPKKAEKPPSRAKLDAAEKALEQGSRAQAVELGKLEAERDKIEQRIARLQAKHDKDRHALERKRNDEREAYRAALDRWSG